MNECQSNNGGCNQTCTNTAGSFKCSCGIGYTLAYDNLDCEGKKRVYCIVELGLCALYSIGLHVSELCMYVVRLVMCIF